MMNRLSKGLTLNLLASLALLLFLLSSCQEQMEITLNEEVASMESTEDEILSLRRGGIPSPDCTTTLPTGSPTITWPFPCMGEGDIGDCTSNGPVLDGGEVLEDYLNCRTPIVAIPVNYTVEVQTTLGIQYYEGDIAEKCGIYNPWTYLGFDGNCSVEVSDIQALGDHLYSIGEEIAPQENGVFLDKVFIYWTTWDECEFHQSYNQTSCTYKNEATIYPCGAIFWSGSPDCSFCKDVCEYRALAVGFQYSKLVPNFGPGFG
ncbi:MAG: hypothetical protein AAFO03_19220 [Bacteroidota bacterium]